MDNYKNFNNDQKTEFWLGHFKSWRESGLSQKEFCENAKISYWSFRTWYYKNKSIKAEGGFIRVKTALTKEPATSKIVLTLHGEIKIEFNENISEETLRKIFKASEVLND
jgi:hypothetical protein